MIYGRVLDHLSHQSHPQFNYWVLSPCNLKQLIINLMFRGAYINKHIKRRDEERTMDYHKFNLTHVRPITGTIDNLDGITINNRKGQMQRQTRFTEIQRENRILLQKISTIMSKQKQKNNTMYPKINKSLNSTFRRKQYEQIEEQNAKLLKRLQERKPIYEAEKFEQDWKKNKNVIKNLANQHYSVDKRRNKNNSLNKYSKTLEERDLQHCRVRVIDGITFLVTIKLNRNSLKISAENKNERQYKVIEIDRNEGMQFIDEECQGKIELVFQRLRYDKNEQVLYLMGNDVDLRELKQKQEQRNNQKIKVQEEDEEEDQEQEKEKDIDLQFQKDKEKDRKQEEERQDKD